MALQRVAPRARHPAAGAGRCPHSARALPHLPAGTVAVSTLSSAVSSAVPIVAFSATFTAADPKESV